MINFRQKEFNISAFRNISVLVAGKGRLHGFIYRHKSHPEVSEIIEKYRRWKKSGPQS